MKMSKQEVKEEQRQQDIAPEIKSAIRRRGMQMSRQRMLAQVPSADVIITNPTHFAIALRYGRDVSAPKVVAKGQDLIALRIREIAAEHDIAIVENPPLARALYKARRGRPGDPGGVLLRRRRGARVRLPHLPPQAVVGVI